MTTEPELDEPDEPGEHEYASPFPKMGKGLMASYMESSGGQVVLFPCKPGDLFEDDGYVYNLGKRSRRWCIDPRPNLSGKAMRLWPHRLADIGSLQRLSVRCEKIAERQQAVISNLLYKYKAAGITAVTYRGPGTPAMDGSLEYEICEYRHQRRIGDDTKKQLTYSTSWTPKIVSLVDAVRAYTYPAEGVELHRAILRNSQLWKRFHFVNRILDIAIRHMISQQKAEKVYIFEVCGVSYVYLAEELNPGYIEVKRISAGTVVEKVVIE